MSGICKNVNGEKGDSASPRGHERGGGAKHVGTGDVPCEGKKRACGCLRRVAREVMLAWCDLRCHVLFLNPQIVFSYICHDP
jgi:hypothetical protein